MMWFTRRVFIIASMLLFGGMLESASTSAYAYRCGQSRPCAGGYNPYNPDSYNHVTEHGYNAFGSLGGSSASTAQYAKTAHPGQSVVMRWFYDLNPDCTSRGHYEIRLLSRPRGGAVSVQSGMQYPNFPQSNVRWVCDQRKSIADQIIYRASQNFSGQDSFEVEVISPEHTAKQVQFTVMVD